jgi:hypothetical protein
MVSSVGDLPNVFILLRLENIQITMSSLCITALICIFNYLGFEREEKDARSASALCLQISVFSCSSLSKADLTKNQNQMRSTIREKSIEELRFEEQISIRRMLPFRKYRYLDSSILSQEDPTPLTFVLSCTSMCPCCGPFVVFFCLPQNYRQKWTPPVLIMAEFSMS